MRKAFPGVSMGRSPFYVQSRYGPFGYAAGRAASGDIFIYAWQRIQAAGQTTLIRNRGSTPSASGSATRGSRKSGCWR